VTAHGRTAVVLAATAWLSGCVQPHASGTRLIAEAGAEAAPGAGGDGRDASAAPSVADARAPLPDRASAPGPDAPGDVPAEVPAPVPSDASVAPECTPGVRACLDGQSHRVCSREGRWLPAEGCAGGTTCSGGACVCPAGACEDGVLVDEPGYVSALAAVGDFLHYALIDPGVPDSVRTVDLRRGMQTGLQRAPAGWEVLPTLAADPAGTVYWCRRLLSDQGVMMGALLRGPQVLAPIPCGAVRVTTSDLLFSILEDDRLYRRALTSGPAGVAETVVADGLYAFEATDTDLFFTTRNADGTRSALQRIARDDPDRVLTLGERVDASRAFDRLAADASHVYISFEDEILRVGIGGGEAFQTFWSGAGPEIEAIVLSQTHVYWATRIQGLYRCSEAAFWRRSKQRDDEAVMLARRQGVCPTGLALTEHGVHAAVAGTPGPSQILRLRR
jgi:hypothetical protein